jgi:hypothetical protein
MADFRLCSTCRSRSQAGLCHCTRRAISDRSEPTIARLRYSLGGDRPSQTPRHAGSRRPLQGARLDARGRNLPDKEFRYLRTVIVTAAVYRGFSSEREPLPLTFRHRAGVRPYTSSCQTSQSPVFLVNSRHPLVCAPRPRLPGNGALFSRSYEGNLPSSFNTILSSAWVCSTCPPVSVWGTVCNGRAVSWKASTAPAIR